MDRFSFRSALAGGLVAAMVMTALPVLAGVGDAILAGMTTTADQQTHLKGNVSSANLKITNTNPGGSAASFRVESGNPPFKVNRGAKVKKLNVDRVDGFSANQLTRVAFGSIANAADDNGNAVSASIIIPKDGWLIISGSIDGFGFTFDAYVCQLLVDGALVAGSFRVSVVHGPGGDHTSNSEENCSTTGVQQVTAGSHTVTLTIINRATAGFSRATVWALYVPFDGQGNTP